MNWWALAVGCVSHIVVISLDDGRMASGPGRGAAGCAFDGNGALGGPVHLLAVVSAFLEQPTEVAARGAGLLAGHQPVIAETRRRD